MGEGVDDLDFSRRAELTERMDGPCSYESLRDCLRGIEWVSRLTRGYRPTMEFMERVVALSDREPTSQNRELGHPIRPLQIVDVGCGYGEMLRRSERWAEKRGIAVALTGVDLNAHAVRAAREASESAGSRIEWIAGDVYSCAAAAEADVVISSLLTHHLSETEIVEFLAWMERTARRGWFVNDLHRKPMPYRIFSAVMRFGPWHPFLRPDGLTSIRRSFVRQDWVRMCEAAGVGAVEIREYRPARLCVGRVKG
jgi:SAM-dependent methyltransferase